MTASSVARVTAILTLATAMACSDSTEPISSDDQALVAAEFNRLGDSVVASGGADADVEAAPYYGAAALVSRSPLISRIVVSVDGVPTKFLAIATAVEIGRGLMIKCPMPALARADAAPYVCPWGIPTVTKTLFAWEPNRPRRIITLITSTDQGPISTPRPYPMPVEPVPGTATGGSADAAVVAIGVGVKMPVDSATSVTAVRLLPVPAHLEFTDARGRVFWGIKGAQTSTVNPRDRACPVPPYTIEGDVRPEIFPRVDCHIADFTFRFEAVAGSPAIRPLANDVLPRTHTLSGGASILGTYIKTGVWIASPEVQ